MRLASSLLLVAALRVGEAIKFSKLNPLAVKVTDFGAVGDGKQDCTAAFRTALAKVKEAGSGTIEVPAGVFRTGPLELVSGLTLMLQDGAVIKADDTLNLYRVIDPLPSYGRGREGGAPGRREAFLSGESVEMVSILGEGNSTIDGSGLKWWEWRWLPTSAPERQSQWDNITIPHLIEFRNSMYVDIDGLKLRDSPLWHVHFFGCIGVKARNLDIRLTKQNWSKTASKTFAKRRKGCGNLIKDFRPYNTDGIVADSSEDVTIENIVYNGGDDVVALKSGWDCFGERFGMPTKAVRIRNVTVEFTRGSGFAIGSEMSGGIIDVEVTGLRVHCSDVSAIIVKSAVHRGGYIKDVRVKDFVIGNTTSAFSIVGQVGNWTPTPNPECLDEGGSVKRNPPVIEGLTVQGATQLEGTVIDGYPVQLGQSGLTIKGASLTNMQLASSEPGLCANLDGTAFGNSFELLNPASAMVLDVSKKKHNLPIGGRDCELSTMF